MFGKKSVVRNESNNAMTTAQAAEPATRPGVDIYEDSNGITLIADLPGVSRDKLNVHVDGDTLSIEGEVGIVLPEKMEALYADMHYTRYQRSFTLSREMDAGKVDANLKDGVLTLRIPKRVEHQPRRIAVQAQ
jgi:HSP20 family molecular chaperone IbpA